MGRVSPRPCPAPTRPVKIPVPKNPVYRLALPGSTCTHLTRPNPMHFFLEKLFLKLLFYKIISVIYFYSKFHMATKMGV